MILVFYHQLETDTSNDANFFDIVGTGGCRYDNLQCDY